MNWWKEGKDAWFQVCSNAGKATIKLELELGDVLLPSVAHRVPSPARLCRCERRQEARRQLAAEEAAQSTEKVLEVAKETSMKEADADEKVNEAKSQLISDGTRTADSDGDIYDYKIFNETKKMEAQEVLDIIEKRIQNNFLRYQVEKRDQVYKIGEIELFEKGIDDDTEGFQVKIKVKKDALRLEHAMRNIQNSSKETLRINIRQIQR